MDNLELFCNWQVMISGMRICNARGLYMPCEYQEADIRLDDSKENPFFNIPDCNNFKPTGKEPPEDGLGELAGV